MTATSLVDPGSQRQPRRPTSTTRSTPPLGADPRLGTAPLGDPAHRDDKIRQSRRRTLRRMLLLPALLAVLLFAGVYVARELLARREYERTMQRLFEQVQNFAARNQRLPTRSQVLQFDLGTRISVHAISYEGDRLTLHDPGDSILAYTTSEVPFKVLPAGRLVLYLDGDTAWLPPQQFDQQWKKQQQRHNTQEMLRAP